MADITDDFNRANNNTTMGSTPGAVEWMYLVGTWGIDNNRAYNVTGDSGAGCYVESGMSDVMVQVFCPVMTTSAAPGVIARATNASNYILFRYYDVDQSMILYRLEAGSYNQLAAVTRAMVANDYLALKCEGNNLFCYHNNVMVIGPVSESFNNSATRHGLWSYQDNFTRFDDFSIVSMLQMSLNAPNLALRLFNEGVLVIPNFQCGK